MEDFNINVNDAVLLNSFVIRGKRCRVYLHRGILVWETERLPYRRCSLAISDIVAVHPVHKNEICCSEVLDSPEHNLSSPASPISQLQPSSPASNLTNERRKVSETMSPCHLAFTIHYAETVSKNRLRHRLVTLKHTDPRQVSSWVKTLRNLLKGFKSRPKRLLIFVNPFGGKKRGLKIYHKQMAPLLAVAGITSSIVITEAPQHALNILLATPSLDVIDGVACVGGDGTFAEVLNGLMLRAAQDAQLNLADVNIQIPVPKLRVGMVPGGSTDTVAFCLHGTNDVQTAILRIVLGGERGVDLCSVHCDGVLKRFAVSAFSYGFLGDVIKDSEKFRWMGPRRYDYSGFKKFMANKGYEGELRMRVDPSNCNPAQGTKCQNICNDCNKKDSCEIGEWRTIKGRFFMVNSANLSCACPRSPNGIAPYCHAGNGCIDVVLTKHTSIWNNIRLLLRLSSSTRTLFDLPFVEVHRVKEFFFSPSSNSEKSVWNCDGEVLLDTNVQVRVHRQVVKVFAQGGQNTANQQLPACNQWC